MHTHPSGRRDIGSQDFEPRGQAQPVKAAPCGEGLGSLGRHGHGLRYTQSVGRAPSPASYPSTDRADAEARGQGSLGNTGNVVLCIQTQEMKKRTDVWMAKPLRCTHSNLHILPS